MRNLPVYDPFVEFERVFESLWPSKPRVTTTEGNLVPLDIFEKEGQWVLRASLPGVKQEDIDLQIEDGFLSLRGQLSFEDEHKDAKVYRREIAAGTFVRTVRLPDNVDVSRVEATFANGLVTVMLPKTIEEKPSAIKVPIKSLASDLN